MAPEVDRVGQARRARRLTWWLHGRRAFTAVQLALCARAALAMAQADQLGAVLLCFGGATAALVGAMWQVTVRLPALHAELEAEQLP